MEPYPATALRVRNVSTSSTFYTTRLGFTAGATDLTADLATIVDPDGDAVLLVGPRAGDVTPHLSAVHQLFTPGALLVFSCRDLAAQKTELTQRGVSEVQETQRPWGDPALQVHDPDGYLIQFTVARPRSPEECLALYARGVEALDAALAGLSTQELELTRTSGEWSIRQIAHHLADGDDLWTMALKAALAKPGCLYRHDWYTPDNVWAVSLEYAGRAIEPSVALFRANRAHVVQLVQHVPQAWERSIRFAAPSLPEPQEVLVGSMIESQALHALRHCEEIWQIRRGHGDASTQI